MSATAASPRDCNFKQNTHADSCDVKIYTHTCFQHAADPGAGLQLHAILHNPDILTLRFLSVILAASEAHQKNQAPAVPTRRCQ